MRIAWEAEIIYIIKLINYLPDIIFALDILQTLLPSIILLILWVLLKQNLVSKR